MLFWVPWTIQYYYNIIFKMCWKFEIARVQNLLILGKGCSPSLKTWNCFKLESKIIAAFSFLFKVMEFALFKNIFVLDPIFEWVHGKRELKILEGESVFNWKSIKEKLNVIFGRKSQFIIGNYMRQIMCKKIIRFEF